MSSYLRLQAAARKSFEVAEPLRKARRRRHEEEIGHTRWKTLHRLNRDLFLLLRHDVTYGEDLEIIIRREGNIISSSWKLSTSP